MRIFEHNFSGNKEKGRRHTVVCQVLLTQLAGKFAKKTCVAKILNRLLTAFVRYHVNKRCVWKPQTFDTFRITDSYLIILCIMTIMNCEEINLKVIFRKLVIYGLVGKIIRITNWYT